MAHVRCKLTIAALLCILSSPGKGRAATAGEAVLTALGNTLSPLSGESSRTERPVGRGVTHIRDFQSSGPLTFNVLRVNLADPQVTVEVEPGQDRLFGGETVPETAQRESRPGHAVLGAVNADFWAMSPRPFTPNGILVANGMICRPPGRKSVFGVTAEEKVFFDPVTLTVSLSAGGKSLKIEKINDPSPANAVTLFTPPIGPAMPQVSTPRLVMELDLPEFLPNKPVSARVLRKAAPGEAVELTSRTVVLAAPEAEMKKLSLKPGASVRLDARIPEVSGVVTFCCGAQPRLLRGGRVSVESGVEKVGKAFTAMRHPRTAAGVSADGRTLFLVTVDGRQPTISVGQALNELAQYMLSLGCSDAVNFDGGGSTTMVVRGQVVNHPSDAGGPRRVVNSLLVVSTSAPGPLAQLEVHPRQQPLVVPAGSRAELSVEGFDADFNPLPLGQTRLQWSASGAGQVQPAAPGRAIFQAASRPASGIVRVGTGQLSAELPVEVVPVESLSVQPEVLLLTSGETAPLKIEATGSGRRIPLRPEMVRVSPGDRAVSATAQAVTGLQAGRGRLLVEVGGRSVQVPYYVDQFEKKPIESFDQLPGDGKATGSNFDAARTRLTPQNDGCREGSGCVAVEYAMNKAGGRSDITIPVNAAVEDEPARIGLWIHGDGKEAWVRGELVDAAGTRFLVDFTEGSKGVLWKDEWRHVSVPVAALTGRGVRPGTRPRFPAKFRSLTISQEQEALKTSGRLVFDGLEGIYPPAQ